MKGNHLHHRHHQQHQHHQQCHYHQHLNQLRQQHGRHPYKPLQMLLLAVVLCSYITETDAAPDVSVYQFQEDDRPSDSHLLWRGDPRAAFNDTATLTLCARLRFFSVWEVSRFVQLTDQATGKHAIQIDLDVRRIRVAIGGLRRYHRLRGSLRALTWHHLCIVVGSASKDTADTDTADTDDTPDADTEDADTAYTDMGETDRDLRDTDTQNVDFNTDEDTNLDRVVTYVDGVKQDEHLGRLMTRVTGTQLKIGAGDVDSNFHGQLTQVNIWSKPLSEAEISWLSLCKRDSQGDIIAWNSEWETVGKVVYFKESLPFFCKAIVDPKYYLFPPMGLDQGFTLCEGLGGHLPTPENRTNLRATHRALSKLMLGTDLQCKGYWLGATDKENEGTWIRMLDGQPITPFWRPSEPDGGEVQNCARGTMETDLEIEDIPCDWKQCVLCVVPKLPVWSMLGACQIHDRNRLFALVQEAPGELLFEGYSYYTIEKRNNTWYWVEKEGNHRNHTIATLVMGSSIKRSWPMGRHSWRFEKSVCEEEPGEIRTLLLSPCEEGHFTCDDATCIPLFQRCDLKPDCRDGSDEKSCGLVQFPLTYRDDIPPAALGSENPLQVALHVTLESADIDTASMMMHVNYNLTMTWSDPRLKFLNLNEDRTLNRVKQEMVKEVWVPVVDFTNTKGNHYTLADHESTMMVNMQGVPTLGDDAHAEEEEGFATKNKNSNNNHNNKNNKQCHVTLDSSSLATQTMKSRDLDDGDDSLAEEVEVYPGTQNSLSIRRKYSETFQCQFDLTRYPFDKQGCEMELTMLSASSRLLQFDDKNTVAEFSGNRHLIEYTVGEVRLHYHNDRDFAVMFIEVELIRRAGFILMNVYIPSMCLLVISYLTLYFKPAIFQVRMLGSLTTLLVMATLFTQASSQLPKSSYFKLVDVWLLSSILIIFTIIVFHAIIDRLQDTPKPAIPKHPLSAIIVKPDIGQCKSPHRKVMRKTSSPTCTIKSETRPRSRGSRIPSSLSNRSLDGRRTPVSPIHSVHSGILQVVTTFSELGLEKEDESSATGTARDDLNSRKPKNGKNKVRDNCSEESVKGGRVGVEECKKVGMTYKESHTAKKRDSFVAMERAQGDSDDDIDVHDDDDNGKLRRRIEWRCWKWSCKDVDLCKTMILTSRIVILIIVVVFNICYWSIALGTE